MTVKSNCVLQTENVEEEKSHLRYQLQNRLTKYTDSENEHYIKSYKASTLSNYYHKNLIQNTSPNKMLLMPSSTR